MGASRSRRLAAALLLAAGLTASARGEDATEAPVARTPFLGLEGLDVGDIAHRDPRRLALLAGAGPLLGRTRPISWASLEPHAPVLGGRRHLRDWDRLDAALAAWQAAGLDPVLVLDPRSPWASLAREESAWVGAVRAMLPPADADLLTAAARGATPPRDETWIDWERLVRDLVERYDADGKGDADGVSRRVAWIQVVERPTEADDWLGSAAEYGRLLHLASQGAARSCLQVGIVHGVVDLSVLGHTPVPDDAELRGRLTDRTRTWPPALAFEARRGLDLALLTLSLDDLFAAALHGGSEHLADERADLAFLRRFLDRSASASAEVWLARASAARLGEPEAPGVRGPDAEERRIRTHRGDRAWQETGRAYEVVRSAATALAAGASRVFVGGHGEGEGLDGFVAPRAGGGWRRTASWYALRQANALLAGQVAAFESRIGRDALAWRFVMKAGAARPWVTVVALDPDISWAGDPRLGPVARDVALPLPDGRYVVEQSALDEGEPKRRHVQVRGGGLRLVVTSAPVWVYPDA